MTHSIHYSLSFQTRFYGSHDPTNSVTALKDDGESTTSGGQSHQAKEKDVSKNFFSYRVP